MTSIMALYRRVMSLECKGLCWESCGPVDASNIERERIAAYTKTHRIPFVDLSRERSLRVLLEALNGKANVEELFCPYLVDHRCSIHSVRPMVCRLWGSIERLPCPHGCEPKGGLLTSQEGYRLMDWSERVPAR